jgi:hypothetical protein
MSPSRPSPFARVLTIALLLLHSAGGVLGGWHLRWHEDAGARAPYFADDDQQGVPGANDADCSVCLALAAARLAVDGPTYALAFTELELTPPAARPQLALSHDTHPNTARSPPSA